MNETSAEDVAGTVDQLISQLNSLKASVPAQKQHAIDVAVKVIQAVKTEAQAEIAKAKKEVEAEKAKVQGAAQGARGS
jgi:hypothetical protein